MATSGEQEVRDEDRLPWLETVDDNYDEGVPIVRIVLLVLLALAVLGGAIFGYQYLRRNQATDGKGALIAAQEGDYKVKPETPGGAKVDGEGDTAIATSNGTTGNASIALSASPETPVAARKGPKPVPSPTGAVAVVTQIPAKAAASGGSLVQLGSFPDAASADAAWAKASKAMPFVAAMGKSVQAAQVDGHTVYRLRVNAGSVGQATELCGKIKAAGAACFVPKG